MKPFFTLKLLLIFCFFLGSRPSGGQSIFSNSITASDPSLFNPFTTGQSYFPGITVSGIGRGTGILPSSAADRYNASVWNTPALNGTSYFEFILTANAGYQINFISFVYNSQASGTGPNAFAFRSSLDGFTTDIGTPSAGGTTIDLTGTNYQGITSSIIFRFYAWGASGVSETFSIDDFTFNGSVTPASKYYRSIASGNWGNPAIWESSADSATWVAATFPPAASDKHITIQTPDVVTASSSISLDETSINGTLQVITGGVLNINNGINDDITIPNNGVLQIVTTANYNLAIIPAPSSSVNVATGGKIQIGDGTVIVGTGYEGFASSPSNVWNDASTFEWNSSTPFKFGTNIIYFQNAGIAIPNFLITKITTSAITGTAATVNGLLIVNSDMTFNTTGAKVLRDGIAGNSQLTLNAGAGGTYTISSPNAIIGGTVTINLNKDLALAGGATIPPGASVNIIGTGPNNIVKGPNGVFLVNGIVDMHSTNISNTSGSVTINGTLKTSNVNGLYGTGATVINGSLILNANSTVEYNATGPQNVQGITVQQYYNVTFSGSGIKTLQSNNSPAGTITVSGSAIFDAQNSTFGAVGTNLTMTGTSRYINGGSTTKPDARGIYTLGDNTTIEFAGASGVTIRLGLSALHYANIVVSGTDVTQASGVTGISFKPGGMGTFTVKNGATFKLKNTAGFTGSNATAIDNTNAPTVILEGGSTVEYSGANQAITNQAGLPYSNLKLSGSGNKTAPAGILNVQGQLLKSGTSTFLHNGGTVLLDGTGIQNFAGLTYNNLILSNSTKITAGSSTIIDSIKVNAGATLSISNNDIITLHSDAVRTARIGQQNGGTIDYNATGKFIVERYISSKRAWRFLSIATNDPSQSIKNQWQEGAASMGIDPKPGYGTQITSNLAAWPANGFDSYSQNGPSMKYYDPVTDTYIGIPSTTSAFNSSLGGYMTFVRGDRSATVFGSPVTSTVLRSNGALFTGAQPDIVAKTGKFIPVNNPFASSIDLRKISASYNVFYYVWDPNRTGGAFGLGAFQTLAWNGTDYSVIPGSSGSYGTTNNFIESGQAFFAGTLGADTSMQLTENAKSDATFAVSPFTPAGATGQQLRTNLYAVGADGSTSLADGVLSNFSDSYDNAIDGMDARKLANFGEDLSIQSHRLSLVVERRKTVRSNDTVFYNMARLRTQPYRLTFIADQLDKNGLDAYLEDSYLKTRTLINLNGTTEVDFTVDNNPASAGSRFQIVFEAAAGALPVTFTNVKAYQKGEDITLEWNVENETGIKKYEIEKSCDDAIFIFSAVLDAKNSRVNNYNWIDVLPAEGYHYYRIKSIGRSGEIQYSKIVQVFISKRKQEITIYPNPVINGIINLQFVNQPIGVYNIRLANKAGQVFVSKEINHSVNTGTEKIEINANAAHGIYDLEIIKPDKSKVIKKIIY